MKKTILLLLLLLAFNFAPAQTNTKPNIGYIFVSSSPEADADFYITSILNCKFSTNYNTAYQEKYNANMSFYKFVRKKYGLIKSTGPQGSWNPMRMKTTTKEDYNRILKNTRKKRKVIVVNSQEYKCDCKSN